MQYNELNESNFTALKYLTSDIIPVILSKATQNQIKPSSPIVLEQSQQFITA